MNNNKDDDMDWGDEDDDFLTSETFDIIQTQAIAQCSTTKSLEQEIEKLKEELDAKEGQITILQTKLGEKNTELYKERQERNAVIETKLKEQIGREDKLKQHVNKLQSELKFKEQDLSSLKDKLKTVERKGEFKRPNTSNRSPKKLKTSSDTILPKFIDSTSFFKETVTKESVQTQTLPDENVFQSRCCLNKHYLKLGISIIPEIVDNKMTDSNSTMFNSSVESKNVSNQKECKNLIFALPQSTVTTNMPVLQMDCDYPSIKNLFNETYLLNNATIVLTKYLAYVSVLYEKYCNSSAQIFSSDSNGEKLTPEPEPLELKFLKWSNLSESHIVWQQELSSAMTILKLLYQNLTLSSELKTLLIQDTSNFHRYPLYLPPGSQSTHSSKDSLPKNELNITISSVLFAAAIPIKINEITQNKYIVKKVLDIFILLLKHLNHSSLDKYSIFIKNLSLNNFIQDLYGTDISILSLQLISLTCRSQAANELFSKHQGSCVIRAMSSNFQKIKKIPENQWNRIIFFELESLCLIISLHGVEGMIDSNCCCLRSFMYNFLSWLLRVFNYINEDLMIKCLTFLRIVSSINLEQMGAIGQKMQNFVLVVQNLLHKNTSTKIGLLVNKLQENFPSYKPI